MVLGPPGNWTLPESWPGNSSCPGDHGMLKGFLVHTHIYICTVTGFVGVRVYDSNLGFIWRPVLRTAAVKHKLLLATHTADIRRAMASAQLLRVQPILTLLLSPTYFTGAPTHGTLSTASIPRNRGPGPKKGPLKDV